MLHFSMATLKVVYDIGSWLIVVLFHDGFCHRLLLLKLDTQPHSHLGVDVCIQRGMSRHVYCTPHPPMWYPTPSM